MKSLACVGALKKMLLKKMSLKQVRSRDEKAGCLTEGNSSCVAFTNVR